MTSAAGMKYWRERHGYWRLSLLPRANFGSSVCRTWPRCSCVEAGLLRPPYLSRSTCHSHVMLVMRRSLFRRLPWLHSSNTREEIFLRPRVRRRDRTDHSRNFGFPPGRFPRPARGRLRRSRRSGFGAQASGQHPDDGRPCRPFAGRSRAVLAEADGDPMPRSSCSRRQRRVGASTGSYSGVDWHFLVRRGACLPSGVGLKQHRSCIRRVRSSSAWRPRRRLPRWMRCSEISPQLRGPRSSSAGEHGGRGSIRRERRPAVRGLLASTSLPERAG